LAIGFHERATDDLGADKDDLSDDFPGHQRRWLEKRRWKTRCLDMYIYIYIYSLYKYVCVYVYECTYGIIRDAYLKCLFLKSKVYYVESWTLNFSLFHLLNLNNPLYSCGILE
jgi:hypothetical protein